MTRILTAAFAATCAFCFTSAPVLGANEEPVLAKQLLPARGGARLTVRSDAFAGGDAIPDRNSQNGENVSPPLEWSKGPQGTRSYVVLAEDAGGKQTEPIIHWIVYNLDLATVRLPPGLPAEGNIEHGGNQGKNVAGKIGYIGPKPPAGEEHPYHFQVFALNAKLNLDPATADRDAVIKAMKGKVIAEGDLIGTYTGK